MTEMPELILSGLVGVLLGAGFFGGLWWTVRKTLSSSRPAVWVFGSMLLRVSAVVAGLFFVAGGRWERLLACLLGFIVARLIVIRLTLLAERRHAP
ncbi:MAG: ATP synthase subunit I [Archangium sp.]|nr:ATP synthase subunit I [Archangium sp.]MDP3574179.1 ATP synthase subunit I [Archangium sp.]